MDRMKLPDTAGGIAGQRFGKLIAVRPTAQRLSGHIVWECRCDCGKTTFVTANNLKRGNTQSCGCIHSEAVSQCIRNDLTGQKYGRLTAIRATEKRISGSIVWECRCECGNIVFVAAADLRKGDTTSCGCLAKENLAKRKRADLHGQRFGYLTALQPTQKRVHGCIVWECRCDCGETIAVPSERLTSGVKISCGCISKREYERLHA